jgi:glycosyltransferase involved in cell wall biosynthesis
MPADSASSPARVTVLDLRDSPWVDGPGRTILDCATSLRARGYDLVIGTFSGGREKTSAYAEEAGRRRLTVRTVHERGPLDHRVVGQVLRLIDEVNADIVHTHDFRSNLFGLLAARLRRRPAVATVHGWIANDLKGRIYVAASKLMLRGFDRVIAVSERTGTLVRKARVPERKIAVINNALVIDDYAPDRGDDRFRRELGARVDTVLIANIGRLSPEKGQFEFLQAAREIAPRWSNARFVLVGVGPDRDKLAQFVAANRLEDAVIFTGYRGDMHGIYNGLDLVVQSSLTEGMPNVVLEALLMQVPVIATDVGGTSEIVTHARTGELIPAGSVASLVERIEDFLRDPERHRAMARAGREDVARRFDHRRRVDRLAAIYRGLLEREP